MSFAQCIRASIKLERGLIWLLFGKSGWYNTGLSDSVYFISMDTEYKSRAMYEISETNIYVIAV